MENTSEIRRIKVRDIERQKERVRIQFFEKLVSYFVDHAEEHGTTKRKISELLGKDPAVISRWLSHPTNLTVDSICELLLAMEAEPKLQIDSLKYDPPANYVHSWMTDYINPRVSSGASVKVSDNLEKTLPRLHIYASRSELRNTARTPNIRANIESGYTEEATNA